MINQYQGSEKHPGNQPTRVLVNNVIASFENVYPDFREEAKTHYEKYGLKPGIPYTIANEPLFSENNELTPYSDRDENGEEIIALSETLLSYVWCVCYTLSTFYYEMMFVPGSTGILVAEAPLRQSPSEESFPWTARRFTLTSLA